MTTPKEQEILELLSPLHTDIVKTWGEFGVHAQAFYIMAFGLIALIKVKDAADKVVALSPKRSLNPDATFAIALEDLSAALSAVQGGEWVVGD